MPGPYVLSTTSGALLDLEDPSPDFIRHEDIAGPLSRICRFAAQAREFYSVAQHALLVRRLVVEAGHEELALLTLHHDSHEAYVGDVATPQKRLTRGIYEEIAAKLDAAIAAALEIPWPEEAARLLPCPVNPEIDAATLPPLEHPSSPREAEQASMRAHRGGVELRD